jgi:hypothetical protein
MMPYHRSVHGPPQPGWYPDPWAQSWYRWWNGERWTPSVHPEQVYVVEPRPPHVTHSFSPVASIAVLAATFVAILLTRTVVDNIGIDADWIVILIAYTVLFGLMTSSAVLLSRTLGSGSLRRDRTPSANPAAHSTPSTVSRSRHSRSPRSSGHLSSRSSCSAGCCSGA